MEGGYYFNTRRSFGCIDNAPWVARKAASGAAAKEYYEVGRAALQGESDEAYFVVDYGSSADYDGRRRGGTVGMYIGGAAPVCTAASGYGEHRSEAYPASERDGYGYGDGEYYVGAERSASVNSACSTSSSGGSELPGAAEECIYARPAPSLSAPASLHHHALSSFYSAPSAQIDGSPPSPAAAPLPTSVSWLSSDTFLDDLQDIDDSWLDTLPPLHLASSSSSSSPSSSSAGGASCRPPPVASPAPPQLAHCSPLYAFNCNPNAFNAFPDSVSIAAFDVSPLSFDVSPAPQESYPAALPSPAQPPTSPSSAARASSVDRKRLKRLDLSEPKYVVLTRNYESVLKDGFKWRKYGQKSVKNNIYPRSYYKCSYEGCYVHKHVERVALDPCLILTTYRGRHTH